MTTGWDLSSYSPDRYTHMIHTIIFVTAGLLVERQMVCILADDDGSHQGRRSNTVPEDISRTGSPSRFFSRVVFFLRV